MKKLHSFQSIVEFIRSYPIPEAPAPEETTDYYLYLIDHRNILFEHLDEIQKDPELSELRLLDAWAGSAYIGKFDVNFGQIVSLWESGKWTGKCKKCGGTVYITNCSGSVLSGGGSAWGFCAECRKYKGGFTPFKKYFWATRKKVEE